MYYTSVPSFLHSIFLFSVFLVLKRRTSVAPFKRTVKSTSCKTHCHSHATHRNVQHQTRPRAEQSTHTHSKTVRRTHCGVRINKRQSIERNMTRDSVALSDWSAFGWTHRNASIRSREQRLMTSGETTRHVTLLFLILFIMNGRHKRIQSIERLRPFWP